MANITGEIGGFIPVSDILLRTPGAGPTVALVYGVIMRQCLRHDGHGTCYMSQKNMARLLGVSRITIWRALCWLEDNGYIARVRDHERAGDTVVWRPTGKLRFRVNVILEGGEDIA